MLIAVHNFIPHRAELAYTGCYGINARCPHDTTAGGGTGGRAAAQLKGQ